VSRQPVPSLNQVFEFGTAVVLPLAERSDDLLLGFDRRLNRPRVCRVGSRLREDVSRHPSAGDRCCSDKPAWRAGLARDRLTPTGQARGIGMRKYSKILGAFSMSLASLLGFVEACHAQVVGQPIVAK
jgi:hypothetical protein